MAHTTILIPACGNDDSTTCGCSDECYVFSKDEGSKEWQLCFNKLTQAASTQADVEKYCIKSGDGCIKNGETKGTVRCTWNVPGDGSIPTIASCTDPDDRVVH